MTAKDETFEQIMKFGEMIEKQHKEQINAWITSMAKLNYAKATYLQMCAKKGIIISSDVL